MTWDDLGVSFASDGTTRSPVMVRLGFGTSSTSVSAFATTAVGQANAVSTDFESVIDPNKV